MNSITPPPASNKMRRTRRVPVQVSEAEYDEIEEAANLLGIPISAFVRMKALEAARQ